MAGKVYIVGVGPGDPKLITLKALECLQAADVIIHDRLAPPQILKYAKPEAEVIDAGKMPNFHAIPQQEINQLMVTKARLGKTVARVKGGDPFVFGRGGEEAEVLYQAGIEFEIVPGITSAVAVPAYAGIPVTHRDFCASFHVITGRQGADREESSLDYGVLAKLTGTLVFLMGVGALPDICENLITHGKSGDTPVAVIEQGTTPRQRVISGTLADIAAKSRESEVKSPAVTVIGAVVGLKEQLAWYPKGPLAGKRFMVTRSREQAGELAEKIEALGGEVVQFPTIQIVPPVDFVHFDQVLQNISRFQWIIFTSVNGVQGFFKRFREKGLDIRALYGIKLCAVGPAAKTALNDCGLQVEFVPGRFTTEDLLTGLISMINPGEEVLLARADIANPQLAEGLFAQGIKVEELAVYRTVPAAHEKEELITLLRDGQVDCLTFTSSSAVHHFLAQMDAADIRLVNQRQIICIGPITAKTATESGLCVAGVADTYSIDGLLEKLTQVFFSPGHPESCIDHYSHAEGTEDTEKDQG